MKAISFSRLPLPFLSYKSSYYVFNWHILALKEPMSSSLKELLWPLFPWIHILEITQWDTWSKSQEISWCLYLEYLFLLASMNNDPIRREYMINLQSQSKVKATANFSTSSIFSQGWETIQWSSLVEIHLRHVKCKRLRQECS